MVRKSRCIYGFLGPTWVLITMAMAPVIVIFGSIEGLPLIGHYYGLGSQVYDTSLITLTLPSPKAIRLTRPLVSTINSPFVSYTVCLNHSYYTVE